MADAIVWNLASKALELLGKEAVRKAASWWGARDDLHRLGETMRMIQARVRDAEKCQEDASGEAIKEWLQRLRQVLYQAEDLFDEVVSLDRLKQQRMEKSMLGKVGILFTKSGPLYYNRKLANEIKSIRKQLDAIKSDMADLNLSNLPAQEPPTARLMEIRETASHVNTEDVIGREKDKNNIIEMLLDPKKDGEQMTVISIVGFGGLGKTTLAQLVFSDKRVQKHFELTRWAYVPETDNKIVMMRKAYRSLTDKNYDNLSLEQIQQGIRETIKDKKYLLVLDDIWDEGDDIKELLNLFKEGKHGSKVIVTTRSDVVAKHFGPIQAAYKLGTLTDVQSRELFKKLAFGPGYEDNNPAFSTIGEQIVEMCKNVPLVIKIIGSSLCSKHTTEEWLQVKNDLSKAQLAGNNKITAVLKLSYDYLPPKSKLCFAYCSLFPKGYEFEKDDLVHLWMAQGYVELDKGQQYFSDLVARNLFQVTRDLYVYKMHDLLHDLAQAVAGDESIMSGNELSNQIHNRLVHVNLNGVKSPPSLKNANRLRSLLTFDSNATDDKLFSEFHSLRALSMRHLKNEKLLNPIGMLIHLRYLKLESEIKYLPDSITRLVNLQTLHLKSCKYLKELPSDFARLVNLRHLLLPMCLTDLPPGFGKLTCLQKLNRFIVEKGCGIDSLGAWSLRGGLVIEFHRWRRDAIEEVKRTNLKNNHQLTSLELQLGFGEEEITPTAAAAGEMNEMLRCLQLPPQLRNLEVRNYKGDEMPVRWLDGLSQLVSIYVFHCRVCKVVPKLSGLPHLKSLELSKLEELEYVEDEDNIRVGTASATHNRCFFPSLEVLKLRSCSKLKGWRRSASKNDGERRQLVFPCLLKMEVSHCPMLMSMPLAPKLESLDVHNINWKMVETSKVRSNDDNEEEAAAASSSSAPQPSSSSSSSTLSSFCNLSILTIRECSELRNLRVESSNSIRQLLIRNCRRLKDISEVLQHLCGLEKLVIEDCEQLVLEEEEEQREEEGKSSNGGWQGLSSLRELRLERIPKVKTLPRGIGCITTLQQLRVIDMENLTEIPEEIGNLSLLRLLHIMGCPKVKSLPPSILGLPMLQQLFIRKMENLTAELPAGEIIGNGNLPLPLLRDLSIVECPKMKSLPTSIQGLASLQTLEIFECPDLAKKMMPLPGGEDWHLIQHIPNFNLRDGSKAYKKT